MKNFEEHFGAKYQEFYELNIENLDNKVFFKVAVDFILETILKMKHYIPFNDQVLSCAKVVKLQNVDKELWNRLGLQFASLIDSLSLI